MGGGFCVPKPRANKYREMVALRQWAVYTLLMVLLACVLEFLDRVNANRFTVAAGAYCSEADTLDRVWRRVQRVLGRDVTSGVSVRPGPCSFCENRTRIVIKCKDDRGVLFDSRLILYVLLHELAHTQCSDTDAQNVHGPRFVAIFDGLLSRFPELDRMPAVPAEYFHGC
jgi:hypothetical protein